MVAMASQITSLTIVHSTVYSNVDQRKHQSSAPLAFVRGIHRWPVNSSHKLSDTRKRFAFGDVIMTFEQCIQALNCCNFENTHYENSVVRSCQRIYWTWLRSSNRVFIIQRIMHLFTQPEFKSMTFITHNSQGLHYKNNLYIWTVHFVRCSLCLEHIIKKLALFIPREIVLFGLCRYGYPVKCRIYWYWSPLRLQLPWHLTVPGHQQTQHGFHN